jgi:hypothetical protein
MSASAAVTMARSPPPPSWPAAPSRSPRGQGGQRDAGHPAGGVAQHRAHAVVRERDAVQREDLAGLGLGGREVRRVHVGDRALQPVPEPVDLQVATGGQDEPQRRPAVPGEEVELLGHPGAGEYVGVVEHEHDRLGPAVEGGGQPVHRRPVRVDVRPGRQGEADPLEPRDHVRPERAGIAVGRVEADPHRHPRHPAGSQPGPQQRRLARSGGRW